MEQKAASATYFSAATKAQLRHALKSGIAASLAALCHQYLPWAEPGRVSWAVLSALLVMQTNLGGSFKASGQRLLGTAVGALFGALISWGLGSNLVYLGVGIGLTILLCSYLGLRESFRLAGVTFALVMLSGQADSPWVVAFQRSLDVTLGIGVALLTQAIIWPITARTELRLELARAFTSCNRLYREIVDSRLRAEEGHPSLDKLTTELRQSLQRLHDLMKDWQSEPAPHSSGQEGLISLISVFEEVLHLLSALAHTSQSMGQDTYYQKLQAPLLQLMRLTSAAFDELTTALMVTAPPASFTDLHQGLLQVEREYETLRQTHACRNFDGEEILRFCTFYLTLKDVTRALQVVEMILTQAPLWNREPVRPSKPKVA